jgi:hypothetical protein
MRWDDVTKWEIAHMKIIFELSKKNSVWYTHDVKELRLWGGDVIKLAVYA